MDVYVDRSDFEYCKMDTYSAYIANTGSCLDEVIKPDMRNKYKRGLKGFCTDDQIDADANFHWFPCTCCPKHTKYDKRTPGLFKLEYQGDALIGLCSKTYMDEAHFKSGCTLFAFQSEPNFSHHGEYLSLVKNGNSRLPVQIRRSSRR